MIKKYYNEIEEKGKKIENKNDMRNGVDFKRAKKKS